MKINEFCSQISISIGDQDANISRNSTKSQPVEQILMFLNLSNNLVVLLVPLEIPLVFRYIIIFFFTISVGGLGTYLSETKGPFLRKVGIALAVPCWIIGSVFGFLLLAQGFIGIFDSDRHYDPDCPPQAQGYC